MVLDLKNPNYAFYEYNIVVVWYAIDFFLFIYLFSSSETLRVKKRQNLENKGHKTKFENTQNTNPKTHKHIKFNIPISNVFPPCAKHGTTIAQTTTSTVSPDRPWLR